MSNLKQKIVITDIPLNRKKDPVRVCASFEDDNLSAIQCMKPDDDYGIGGIYVGRVKKIAASLNAAFVEIAPGMECYLAFKDADDPIFVKKINAPRLVQGDELVVQIQREAIKMKPAALTTNINLTGQYLVLTSQKHHIGVSAKLKEKDRERLKFALNQIWKGDCGIIVRTAAANATEDLLTQEYNMLYEQLCEIKKNAPYRTCFSCLKAPVPEYETFVREHSGGQKDTEVVTDILEVFEHLRLESETDTVKFGKARYAPKSCIGGGGIRLYTDETLSLASLYSLLKHVDELLSEKVWMKSGGFLVIQHTEAMTVIDVNSGKSLSKKQAEEQRLKINLEAAKEISRQIRLRNLSGIIIIDFIDLDDPDNRSLLLKELKSYVKTDPIQTNVVDMTRLQLAEVTRKKVRKSLKEQLT